MDTYQNGSFSNKEKLPTLFDTYDIFTLRSDLDSFWFFCLAFEPSIPHSLGRAFYQINLKPNPITNLHC